LQLGIPKQRVSSGEQWAPQRLPQLLIEKQFHVADEHAFGAREKMTRLRHFDLRQAAARLAGFWRA
jgi:hypothetical protein